ncbi:nucleoporin GLE1 Ecym_5119 [Eremothecium cymbalariae DBVPG|uniref:mRNA export factor GLE1 n=1 Tax=Eremothecium cymbalariae (strain CBS 270.75 / DBVPG 7215 / KCTC 17166 / NRRL Y-17582) TaxID=931890 RepID=I6NCV7_ERECY|nr:hypothetical protein Ecym_5119 [Eremothecium cymbalariae DBVPG\
MRFAIDELLDAIDEAEVKQTYIGHGADVLQMKLGNRRPNDVDEPVELDASLQRHLEDLHISDKIPKFEQLRIPLGSFRNTRAHRRVSIPVINDDLVDENKQLSKPNATQLMMMLKDKMAELERANTAHVQNVLKTKKMAEIKLARQEEEQLRRAAEERKKREEEQRLKEAERKKVLAEESERKRRLKEEADKKQKEQLRMEQEHQEALRKTRAQEEKKKKHGVTNFESIEVEFLNVMQKIRDIKRDIVNPVKKDRELEKLLGTQKRKINPKFGQLTNSLSQLQQIRKELIRLIDEIKNNNLAYNWILNFVAKAVVSQAETEVRVKPESALPLANLTLSLLVKYPDLYELLMARFIKKCPYVIGYMCGIDTEEGRLRMGWKRSVDGKWEDDISYNERLGGIMTLYAVISRLPLAPEFISNTEHPLPLSCSWKILARFANKPIIYLTNTEFILLGYWWDAAAAQFLQRYGNQGSKLLNLVASDLTAEVAAHKYVGAARLRILLEDWKQTGRIKTFPEMVT